MVSIRTDDLKRKQRAYKNCENCGTWNKWTQNIATCDNTRLNPHFLAATCVNLSHIVLQTKHKSVRRLQKPERSRHRRFDRGSLQILQKPRNRADFTGILLQFPALDLPLCFYATLCSISPTPGRLDRGLPAGSGSGFDLEPSCYGK